MTVREQFIVGIDLGGTNIVAGAMPVPIAAPYGSWPSPITTDLVASEGGVSFGYLDIDEHGVYWTESRPQESGRSALVFRPHKGEPVDVVPPDFNVRTRVHEYGGGAVAYDLFPATSPRSSAAPTRGSLWATTKAPSSAFGRRSAAKPNPRTYRASSWSSLAP